MQKRSALDSLYNESNAGLDDELPCFARSLCASARRSLRSTSKTTDARRTIFAGISAVLTRPRVLRERETCPAAHQPADGYIKNQKSPERTADELTFSEITNCGRPRRSVFADTIPAQRLLAGTQWLDEDTVILELKGPESNGTTFLRQ